LLFTNGLKCRNKCEVASIPYFCFPTGLIYLFWLHRCFGEAGEHQTTQFDK